MNLNDQVISLELAKRLKELGVKQDSYFAYFFMPHENNYEISIQTKSRIGLPAFSVAELGEMLPMYINDWNLIYCKRLRRGEIINFVFYTQSYKELYMECDITEANARAKMLIHLIENKIWVQE